MNLEARKIAMVKQILNINNEKLIKELEAQLIQLLPSYHAATKSKKSLGNQLKQDISSPPIVEIREKVSLEQIVAAQQTTPISYAEIKQLTSSTNWKYSLTDLLEALN